MTGAPPAEAEGRGVPYAFHYRLPEEFVVVRDPDTAEGWKAALAELMPQAEAGERDDSAERLRRAAPLFAEHGDTLVDLAMCLGAEPVRDTDKLSYGVVVVSVRPSEHRDRLLAAEAAYRAKEHELREARGPLQEVDFELGKGVRGSTDTVLATKLPVGPAVMSVALRSVELRDPARTPEGAESAGRARTLPMAVLQLVVPAARGYCVYVTLTTPSVYLLDSYAERLSHIARTFTFDVPDAAPAVVR
ncbi:hypothetical protein AB0J21_31140 [Streptomyces sp. NPDC049954]|uniref:hypothetical protein n=1 Tax=Streptomyces sp. NPDC049954 TaxID=3155779 RepID=UPI003443DE3D